MSAMARPFLVGPAKKPHVCRTLPLAALTERGTAFSGDQLRIKKMVGQGSFGEVFEGISSANGVEHRVIMKRVKNKVTGAVEMGQLEHLLNVHVAKHAPGSCAEFLGFADINSEDTVADRRITPGTWLLWKYQGSSTLAEYFRRRDCIPLLARDMNIPEEAVPATVVKHILDSLQKLHAAGLVHRDIKPSNIIFCEEDRRFRLIDLGACADLRSGTNYTPDESILDPNYCPPEQYVLPTDAPDLARNAAMAVAMAPVLWVRHKPDRFDMYSLGLVMLQLAMPHLRSHGALQGFHTSFKRCRYDLYRWRTVSNLKPMHTVFMDADGGAGWELAEALLRPRKVQTLADGHVYFINEGKQRPPASEALKYRFIKNQAVEPVSLTINFGASGASASQDAVPEASPQQKSTGGGIFNMFKQLQYKVFQIEADIIRTATAAEQQTTTVCQLRDSVEAGAASPEELKTAENVLQRLTFSLTRLQGDLVSTAKTANVAFRSGLVGTRQTEKEEFLASLDADADLNAAITKPAKRGGTTLTPPYQRPSAAAPTPPPAAPAPKASQGLAGFLFQGIKSMGRAAKMTGAIVEDVQGMVENMEKTAEEKKRTAAEFMQLLSERDVKANDTWWTVQPRLLEDPRYHAVVGERKVALFKSYLTALRQIESSRVQDLQRDFIKLLASRVVGLKDAQWDVLKKEWSDVELFKAVGEAKARELYERHVAEMQAAHDQRAATVNNEAAYRALLEGVQPPVTGETTWAQLRRQIWNEAAYLRIADVRRREIFNEFREIVRDLEAINAREEDGGWGASITSSLDGGDTYVQQLPQGNGRAPPAAAGPEDAENDVAVLDALRLEQARLKAEYDRMEGKLREMEQRLQTRAQMSLDEPAASSNGARR